ncbi:MAG: glycosyltransferase family 39 protein [Candidatus Sumerlaeia bacterium]
MSSRRFPIFPLLALLLVLAAALRLFHIDYRSLWTDEFRTLFSIRLPLADLLRERLSYGHFPTYFVLLKYWTAIFGDTEFALRLPSLICVVAAIPFIFFAARGAWGEPAAWWASIFYLLNARAVWAAQEARPYGLVMLAAAAALHALIRALNGSRAHWWGLFVFWSLLGLVSHATYLFIFAGQALVTALWMLRSRNWRAGWIVSILILAVSIAAAYFWLGSHAAHHVEKAATGKSHGLDLSLFRDGTLDVFWGAERFEFWKGSKNIFILLVLALLFFAWRASRRQAPGADVPRCAPLAALSAAWAFSILFVMLVVSSFQADVVEPRYFAPGLGGACLLMGCAVGSIRGRLQIGAGGLVALILAINAAAWLWSPGEQVRHAVRYVAERRAPDEPVLFCKDTNSALMAEYYRLGVVPQGFSRDELDPEALKSQLNRYVHGAPGFWLILYKEEKSPIVKVTHEWSAARYSEVEDRRFVKTRVRHWRAAAR